MRLYLQMGYGMMDHARTLVRKWRDTAVVLSPRDLTFAQMETVAASAIECGSTVLLDPQFYVPHSDHFRLTKHAFWPTGFESGQFDRSASRQMIDVLWNEYCVPLSARSVLVPARLAISIDDIWLDLTYQLIDCAQEIVPSGTAVYATIPLSADVVRDEASIHRLIEEIGAADVLGVYLIAEPPTGSYLVDDPLWLTNLLDLCAGLKLEGKEVIIGYTTHQDLLFAIAKVDAIASGTFMNVRRFPADKFWSPNPDGEQKRKSVWYYCPQALSEYQLSFLDIAHRAGVFPDMAAPTRYGSEFADVLFRGAQPTTTEFNETLAHRHYLHCLWNQCSDVSGDNYDVTVAGVRMMLETAQELTDRYSRLGIRGRGRDFSSVVDSTMSAVDHFHSVRGMVMRDQWSSI